MSLLRLSCSSVSSSLSSILLNKSSYGTVPLRWHTWCPCKGWAAPQSAPPWPACHWTRPWAAQLHNTVQFVYNIKGTQAWDILGLRFRIIIYCFIVSYAKILNFFFVFFFKLCMTPLYLLIIVFQKFDPWTATGMALWLNLPECQNLFSLVWD